MLKFRNSIKKYGAVLLVGLFLLGSFTSFAATSKTNTSVHKVVVSTQLKKQAKSTKPIIHVVKKANIGKKLKNKTNTIKTKTSSKINNIKK
ncbi:hypothetical protein ACAG39_03900 [Caldicellulosiruptoraceae bacterium PP1]